MIADRVILTAAGLAAACAVVLAADEGPKPEVMQMFDGKAKTLVVNGYSTSFRWPDMLQRKLDRYFDGRRVLTVRKATKGGTPIARWIDVETGEPRKPWLDIVRPALKRESDEPVVVLAQQSLQWAFGDRRAGIRDRDDAERIRRGADVLARYVGLLLRDGADHVFVAMHIYKHPMEPEIGNERLALDELMRREVPSLSSGPDVWTATKELYPWGFAPDTVHPNLIGAEVMAQLWFESLLAHDGIEVPDWSRQEMEEALREGRPSTPDAPKPATRDGM